MKFFEEFKTFISRGNVVDMAVGVVVGTAFTNIINSLVKNIITPLISIITGKVNFASLEYVVNENLSITYGVFIQAIIDFLIIAFCVFCAVKLMNGISEKFKKKEEKAAEVAEEPALSTEAQLLTEIRDMLQNK